MRNVCDAQGMKTVAINYLGDWGKQYGMFIVVCVRCWSCPNHDSLALLIELSYFSPRFARHVQRSARHVHRSSPGLLAVGFDKFGSEEALQQDPIRHLFDVYVQVNNLAKEDPTIDDQARAYFKHMEEGDPSALALWKRFRDLSIHKYREIYARLNIRFDVYSGESLYAEGMKRAMVRLEEKGLLTESDGARVVDLKKYKLGTTVVQKADGATLYVGRVVFNRRCSASCAHARDDTQLTRDIAAAWERHDQYSFDEMYYIVASQQNLHFQQLFKILDLAGFDEWSKRCTHLNFGMVSGMSTRKGTVVFLEDILHEAKSIMHAVCARGGEVVRLRCHAIRDMRPF